MANRTSIPYPVFAARDTRTDTPLAGGKVYTYEVGTTTPKAAYTDPELAVPHTNPIILDANGEAVIYLSGAYKFVIDASDDTNMRTLDKYEIADPSAAGEYAADTGAADAYVVSGVSLQSYTAGAIVRFKAGADNTGASTINVNSLGAKNIVNTDGGALSAGQILTGGVYEIVYDGTSFQLQTATETATQAEVSAKTDGNKPVTSATLGGIDAYIDNLKPGIKGTFSAVTSVNINFPTDSINVIVEVNMKSDSSSTGFGLRIREGGTTVTSTSYRTEQILGSGGTVTGAAALLDNIPIAGNHSPVANEKVLIHISPQQGDEVAVMLRSANKTGASTISYRTSAAFLETTNSNRDGLTIYSTLGVAFSGDYVIRGLG